MKTTSKSAKTQLNRSKTISIPFITVEVARSVKLIRPETGTFKLILKPTDAFHKLPEEEQKAQLKALEKADDFYYNKQGEMCFRDDSFEQYFNIVVVDERWEYSGGECNILNESYDSVAKRIRK